MVSGEVFNIVEYVYYVYWLLLGDNSGVCVPPNMSYEYYEY